MKFFLALQHTYQGIECALFQEADLVEKVTDDKKKASEQIVLLADGLLRANDLSFADLSFFAANQGPGPFTTLRVVIATVNGFAFATQKKIVGVDGLDALLQEHEHKNFPLTAALLNAFSGDLYFGIQSPEDPETEKGYANSSVLFTELKEKFPQQQIRFIGQGAAMYEDELKKTFGTDAVVEKEIEHCTIEQIGAMAWKQWQEKENLTDQLFPSYLKSMKLKTVGPSSF